MKTIKLSILVCILFLPIYSLFGQLNKDHNHLRSGDVLIKQQVEFKDPGEAGENIIWDFSDLKTLNETYTLTYSLPPIEGDSVYILGNIRLPKAIAGKNEPIVGTEHNTMYYYQLKKDMLYCIGHENPSVRLNYTQPMLCMYYPLSYGETVSSAYSSKGLYSSTVEIQSSGEITITGDAYGKLIIPTGDTLTVLKTKTIQTIFDSIEKENAENNGKQLETCRWYAKGYRYPVFETVRNINRNDNSEIFSISFYYPPQEHLYLDNDMDNLELLEEIWKVNHKEQDTTGEDKIIEVSDIMLCKAYPNPVESILNIEYELKEDALVSFQLISMQGNTVKEINQKSETTGLYEKQIDCSTLPSGSYVLKITANSAIFNYVIIKK
ncbi:MAG: T9SS type A sorting domain-containing protein [Bacteroidales bacterium]|nr:T9SS type A sorting domain-containing protein [Bacteroidales bacterium]